MFIATPLHISYETPRPDSGEEGSTASLEEGKDLHPADQRKSLETVEEDADSADDNPLVESMEQSSKPVRPMAVVSKFNGIQNISQQTVISSPMAYHDELQWPNWMSSGPIRESDELLGIDDLLLHLDNWNPSSGEDISSPPLKMTNGLTIPEDGILTMEMLKNDLQNTTQYLERGRHFRAEIEYCMAIQKYVNCGYTQHTKQRIAFTAELVESLRSCTETQERITALASLNLPQSSTKLFHKNSIVQSIALPALENLLVANRGGRYNILNNNITWDDSASLPLQLALRSSLERILRASLQDSVQDPGTANIEQFRLGLLAFACDLQVYLEEGQPRVYHLHDAVTRLWHVQSAFPNKQNENNLIVNELYAMVDAAVPVRRWDIPGRVDHSWSSVLQPLVNQLASAISIAGWYNEAEALFTILRSTQSLESCIEYRKVEISVEYCLHLERQKRYAELLLVLHVAYMDFEKELLTNERLTIYFSLGYQEICSMRDILRCVPSPLDKWIPSDKVLEIDRVGQLLFNTYPFLSGWKSQEVAVEKDTIEVESDDEHMDEGKSSNKFGVTYTESVITGVSLNYSDLYR
jgi:hypothetical protein